MNADIIKKLKAEKKAAKEKARRTGKKKKGKRRPGAMKDRFPKKNNNKELLIRATLNNIINRNRSHRIKRGRSKREATEDTMLHISRYGKKLFDDGIARMRSRKLLGKREDVFFGGRNRIGLGELKKGGNGAIYFLSLNARRVKQNGHTYWVDQGILQCSAKELVECRVRELDSRPVKELTQRGARGSESCAICMKWMKWMKKDEEVLVLPCKHWCCNGCLHRWLSNPINDVCPSCKRPIGKAPPCGRIRAI
ncbi:RING finger domain protein [Penicillium malachiteum]|uniref:RING finger domain protein n=1 Tax=Penicillium malachiteum TaxID=1324776 RepID=A0AAD6HFH9_9EURO|nr:RING finger domain protein [Penicillium malachiteum]